MNQSIETMVYLKVKCVAMKDSNCPKDKSEASFKLFCKKLLYGSSEFTENSWHLHKTQCKQCF